MTNVPISNLTTTWNNVATTFTGIKLNVTDTSSAASSLLMDLQVGGGSQFKVSKSGTVTVGGSSSYAVINAANSDVGRELLLAASVGRAVGITNNMFVTSIWSAVGPNTSIGWSTDARLGAGDTLLFRDAAATLAQRNGVNAQTFRLYNTFTDASNYERGFMRWSSNVLEIGAEAAGTGTQRILNILTSANNKFVFTGASIGYAFAAEAVRASINLNGKSNGSIILTPRSAAPDVTVGLTGAGSFGFNWDRSSAINVTHLITAYRSYNGSYTGPGDNINLQGGNATHPSTSFTGGNILIRGGVGVNGGADGLIIMDNLPTSNPAVAGALWNNSGVLSVSAG